MLLLHLLSQVPGFQAPEFPATGLKNDLVGHITRRLKQEIMARHANFVEGVLAQGYLTVPSADM